MQPLWDLIVALRNSPLNLRISRRFRLTVFGSVLFCARAFEDACVEGILSKGEGCLDFLALLSEDVRESAYKERHVSSLERESLQASLAALSHVALTCPRSHRLRSYMHMFREIVPKTAAILVMADVQLVMLLGKQHLNVVVVFLEPRLNRFPLQDLHTRLCLLCFDYKVSPEFQRADA